MGLCLTLLLMMLPLLLLMSLLPFDARPTIDVAAPLPAADRNASDAIAVAAIFLMYRNEQCVSSFIDRIQRLFAFT
jgi:hypothetical protein